MNVNDVYDSLLDLEDDEVDYIQNELSKAYQMYSACNYTEQEDTLMCSIHGAFPDDGHNCIGCNMEDCSKLILTHLIMSSKQFHSAHSVFPGFIFHLYLMVERLDVYLKKMEIPQSVRAKRFQIFSMIRQWANFVKHPKALMFVHHPSFVIEGFKSDSCNWLDPDPNNYDIVIDSDFVKKYYSNKDNDKSLYDKLTNQDKVIVVYPRPSELVQELCEAQKYFVELINENKVYRELLDENATKYYESQINQDESEVEE